VRAASLSMRPGGAPLGAPPPFFLREEFFGDAFGDAFWLGFSWRFLGKARVRRGIATTDVRMSKKDIRAFSKDRLWRGDDP
jgi:hypothetical protein